MCLVVHTCVYLSLSVDLQHICMVEDMSPHTRLYIRCTHTRARAYMLLCMCVRRFVLLCEYYHICVHGVMTLGTCICMYELLYCGMYIYIRIVCMPVCLLVCLSACLSVCLSVCTCVCICSCVCMYFCLCLLVCLPVCLSVHMRAYLYVM